MLEEKIVAGFVRRLEAAHWANMFNALPDAAYVDEREEIWCQIRDAGPRVQRAVTQRLSDGVMFARMMRSSMTKPSVRLELDRWFFAIYVRRPSNGNVVVHVVPEVSVGLPTEDTVQRQTSVMVDRIASALERATGRVRRLEPRRTRLEVEDDSAEAVALVECVLEELRETSSLQMANGLAR